MREGERVGCGKVGCEGDREWGCEREREGCERGRERVGCEMEGESMGCENEREWGGRVGGMREWGVREGKGKWDVRVV